MGDDARGEERASESFAQKAENGLVVWRPPEDEDQQEGTSLACRLVRCLLLPQQALSMGGTVQASPRPFLAWWCVSAEGAIQERKISESGCCC
jgi:hypothetical protein